MFEIEQQADGKVRLSGRLDAAEAPRAQSFLDEVNGKTVVDLAGLDYISSAGLAVLLRTQKRLLPSGGGLSLVNVSHHVYDILRYSGFDQVFEIEAPGRE